MTETTKTSSLKKSSPLDGRTMWVPRMTYIAARLAAAAFRAVGIDARVNPAANEETLRLGGQFSSGEECFPEKITLGNFLRVINAPDFDPDKTAFFMPTAEGPCRFGQYGPYLRQVLDELGYPDIPIVSPSSKNGYDGVTEHSGEMVRLMWRGLVAADILRKMLLKTRPYERHAGDTDAVYQDGIGRLEGVVEKANVPQKDRINQLIDALVEYRDRFRAVPACYTRDKPLIGVVGEIFCRLNTFSNYEAVRQIEAHGGEVWLSDVAEWVWYTNWSQKALLKRDGKTVSKDMLMAVVKNAFQRRDEHRLLEPFKDDFTGYEEPHDLYADVLEPGWPYLPASGALGEMALSVGKTCYLHRKGADGIIDISPFSCMNGIVSEAVYHAVAADYDEIPIRNFYFDDSTSNLNRDLDIFMELARSYTKRKTVTRRYPPGFES